MSVVYKEAATGVRRDDHWSKDHNGLWTRSLKLEGPRAGYSEWTNLCDYSAGPFQNNSFWDEDTTDIDEWWNVASCVEGGVAIKTQSQADKGVRIHAYGKFGTYSGNIEVMSGIFENVDVVSSSVIYAFNSAWTEWVGANYNWTSGFNSEDTITGGALIDAGWEDLGIGPNGGQMVRIWFAFDSSATGMTGNKNLQWRIDNTFSAVKTNIMHHAQYIEIPSGYTFADNGAPSSLIVNLDATNNSINREQFSIPITFDPQALGVYCRVIQRWRDGQHELFCIGGATGERLKVENSNGQAGTFFFRHHDGTGLVEDVDFGGASGWGDTIEFAGALFSDGSVRGWESVNGAGWVIGKQTAALTFTAGWGEDLVHVGSMDDSNNAQGFYDYQALKITGLPYTALELETYLSLPGINNNYASTPDQTFHPTGDMDIRVEIALDDPSDHNSSPIGKWTGNDQKVWYLQITASNQKYQFAVSTDGSTGNWDAPASTPISSIVGNGERIQLRATRLTSTGAIAYYYKTSGDLASASGWTADGTASLPSGALWNGTEAIDMGAHGNGNQNPCEGKMYRAIVMDGIDGTIVLDAEFNQADGDAASFVESSVNGATVTIQQTGDPQAELVQNNDFADWLRGYGE